MQISLEHNDNSYKANLNSFFDLSIGIKRGDDQVSCYWLTAAKMQPFKAGDFVGSVKEGGPVNCETLTLNPHGNGTHTECVGHVSEEHHYISDSLKEFHFIAILVTISPDIIGNDLVILPKHLSQALVSKPKAIIVRTLPNKNSKLTYNYADTNPPYFSKKSLELLRKNGVDHLLCDLPSVDKEVDGGALAAHHQFWDYPNDTRENATITELIFVPNAAKDGLYLLNIQCPSIQTDAVPSRPIIFPLEQL